VLANNSVKNVCNPMVLSSMQLHRAGLRGGAMGAIAPDPPLQGGPRDDTYLFQIKYSFEKLS